MSSATSERLGPLIERVRAQAATFVTLDREVREGADEAVHAMRVSTRRLRACLRTFRGAFDREVTDRLITELSWIGDVLGAARDVEVTHGSIPAHLRPDGDRQIEDARLALATAMDSDRYRLLVAAVASFAITPHFVADGKGPRWLVRRVKREIERVIERAEIARDASATERDRALHEVRKAAKRARYASETLEPRFGKKARRVTKVFVGLQTVLGEHHDAVVIADVLAEDSRPELAEQIASAIAGERERAARAGAEFDATWIDTRALLEDHWPMG